MSDFYETGPSKPVDESIRVDKVSPKSRRMHNLRALIVIGSSDLYVDPDPGHDNDRLQNPS